MLQIKTVRVDDSLPIHLYYHHCCLAMKKASEPVEIYARVYEDDCGCYIVSLYDNENDVFLYSFNSQADFDTTIDCLRRLLLASVICSYAYYES